MQQIAVVNAGSSTLKLSLFEGCIRRLSVLADRLDGPDARVSIRDEDGAVCFDDIITVDGHHGALAWLFDWFAAERPHIRLTAVGHRVVHGGDKFTAPVIVTPDICEQIRALIPLAPLHQGLNLDAIEFIAGRFPDLLQVACFDTAFHATSGPMERMFALPRSYLEQGVRRYGFHGLSYEYISGRLHAMETDVAGGRSIVCHLGNGASLCAMKRGRSMATTMAFTALDGLPMGTRCGSIDPGVLLYLLEHEKLSVAELSDLLYRQSGLLGISGLTPDMRVLQKERKDHEDRRARLAIHIFCYRAKKYIGAYLAAMGGADAIVFTGGIGENSPEVRALICEGLEWAGLKLDMQKNQKTIGVQGAITQDDSRLAAYVIPTDEELLIARDTVRVILGEPHPA